MHGRAKNGVRVQLCISIGEANDQFEKFDAVHHIFIITR